MGGGGGGGGGTLSFVVNYLSVLLCRSLGFIDLTTQTSSQVIVPDRTHPYIDSYASVDSAVSGALIELTVYYGTRAIRLFLPSSSTVAQVMIGYCVVLWSSQGCAHTGRWWWLVLTISRLK